MNEIIQTRHGEAIPLYLIEHRNGTLEVILELIHQ
jgi:hypothetical protein